MDERTALERWLGGLPGERLTALLEERELPHAAGYTRIDTFRHLAEHLLTDASVERAVAAGTAGDVELLAWVAARALETYGPVAAPERAAYSWRPEPPLVDSYQRLVPEADVRDRLERGGTPSEHLTSALDRLRYRALLLPAPPGQLALPSLLHTWAARMDGYGRPLDTLLTRAYNAPEIKRIAAALGIEPRTRADAQAAIGALLADAGRVRELVAKAPAAAHELLDHMVPGPPLMRTRRFVSRYGGHAGGPDDKYTFRDGGSGDEGTDWLAERGMVVPVGPDLVELPYEVGRALRLDGPTRALSLDAEPLTCVAELPHDWDGQGAMAAGAAAWRAELVLRELAAHPLAVRKAGGVAVRDTRRLAKAAGTSEEHTRLWLDLAVNAGLAAPKADEPEPAVRGRGRGRTRPGAPKPSARLLATDRYDAWAAATPAGKLLPLMAAWAVVPEVLTHWPEQDETPVALISPQDPYAVALRHGVLRALATLPDGYGLVAGAPAHAELLDRAAWFQPVLGLRRDGHGEIDERLAGRLEATLAEAELFGLVAHGALTGAGRAIVGLLEAGAGRHYPAVPGADADPAAEGTARLGKGLAAHPDLAEAVAALREALRAMLPAPSTTARFQADSTATVTGAPAPDLAALLSAVGDIESEGHAVVWRITPVSLRRAFDAGWSADDILERLTAVREPGTELPQPLAYTVKDIARGHGRLRVVRSACCVRSDDTALIAEVAQTRGLAALGLRRIAPTVLISTAPPDETLAALRRAGYAPALEAETGTTVLERVSEERSRSMVPALDRVPVRYGGHRMPGTPSSARDMADALRG
ncbi:helicase-associated domain-containing protein [Streptomyces sp. MI02-7b]|uniref:helicase-associated domain-containing protein n=1 Tax=Streptomyces sp. MI02-7b TaxID=462941 RepID=UPI0029AC36B2|nr:helicase-associated domain-containing protein [Streptomyces sp. MI02-7b]MDX3077479.1 helicase-associated domain-containing protein [Streptomyces sp. MI02-7b]